MLPASCRIEKLGPDPAEFGSEVANRGPLAPDWIEVTVSVGHSLGYP